MDGSEGVALSGAERERNLMKAERWEKVIDLFQSALERAPEERAATRRQVAEFASRNNVRSGKGRPPYQFLRALKDRIVDHHPGSTWKRERDLEPGTSKSTSARFCH